MKTRLNKILSFFSSVQGNPESGKARIDETLRSSASRLRNVDPETHNQWMRLQRTIQQSESEIVRVKPRIAPRLAIATAVLAIFAAAVYFLTSTSPLSPETFATQRGEQKEIVLRDSSQVTLSFASELVAAAQEPDKPRRLSLAGEAYFKVKHTGTPFIVTTENTNVEVVGTEFNVRGRDEGVEIGVVEGAVRVSVVKDGKDSTLLLTKHQMAFCPKDGFPGRVSDIASVEYPGWLHGKLILNQTTLMTACSELEMRFGISIAIHDQNVREQAITGILDARSPESGLSALCALTGKNYTHVGKTYIID